MPLPPTQRAIPPTVRADSSPGCLSDGQVEALLEQRLPRAETERAAAHLTDCAACRELVEAGRIAAGCGPTLSPGRSGARPERDPLIGTTIANSYRVTAQIGSGGMGTVYAAEHVRLGRMMAVKTLGSGLRKDSEALDRFRREALNCAALGNRHIVDVLDFNAMDDGTPFMVMELLTGEDLAQRLSLEGALPLHMTLEVGRQICAALAATHAEGILHRDLKPSNVFLCADDAPGAGPFVKICDFGLSKTRSALASLTGTGQILGTPAYMSPELARAEHARVDHRTDLFSLGAILYECLSGHRAFDADSITGVLYQVVHESPRPLAAICPDAPADLSRLVMRLLAKRPSDRPDASADVGAELTRIAASLPVGQVGPALALAAPPRRLWLLVASAALVAALGLGAWWLAPATPRPSPTAKQPTAEATAKQPTARAAAKQAASAQPASTQPASARPASAHPPAVADKPTLDDSSPVQPAPAIDRPKRRRPARPRRPAVDTDPLL